MNKLKIGIAVGSHLLPAWVERLIVTIGDSPYAEITSATITGIDKRSTAPLILQYLNKKDANKLQGAPDAIALKDTTRHLQGLPELSSTNCDVILNFTTQPLPKNISQPRFGTWQYFFGTTNDWNLAGVQEVLENKAVIECGLELTSPEGRCTIYTSYGLVDPVSIKVTANRCLWKCVSFIPRMLERLHNDPNSFLAIDLPRESTGSNYRMPSSAAIIVWLAASTFRRAINKLKRTGRKRDWILMYDRNSAEGEAVDFGNFRELRAPEGYFWADPMVVLNNGRYYLFVEEFVYAQGKGRISVLEMNEDGSFSEARTVLERPYHLSYPFLFEREGKWYMIPESSDNRTIELYECISFPYEWVFNKKLAEDVFAVDSTVIRHNGKDWLFTNIEEHNGASALDELFIFHSDDIINQELKKCKQNPVISDVRCSRPAGPFFLNNNDLYRPSQICAPYYGWGLLVNKVVTLTEDKYKEEATITLSADAAKKIAGCHTLSYAGRLCVIDVLKDTKN